jgi:2-polyprenyl-3-methyl-5-hydroxy-6-metoxy-1,4-benzoquinol methylase
MSEDQGKRIAECWQKNAGVWAAAVRTQAIESRRVITDEAILDAVLQVGGSRILDVGCGEGWLARRLAGSGRDVVGFDGSRELIDRAKSDGGAEFIHLDYDSFARTPRQVGHGFDAAVCNFSILSDDIRPLLGGIRHPAIRSSPDPDASSTRGSGHGPV